MGMILLVIGIALWSWVHFLKRTNPTLRERLNDKVGKDSARGIVAISIVLSVILMIIGYRMAGNSPVYSPMAGMGHFNNLLMLLSVFLFGMSGSTGRIGSLLRHPMLLGVIVWGIAHLLVNGDLASIILFGSMILWSVVQIILINKAEGAWTRPEPGPVKKDIILVVITLVVFSVITAIHTWLGYNPFLGTYS